MEIFQWARNPWGQEVLVHISWNLLYASAIVAAIFIVAHLLFRRRWAGKEPVVEASSPVAGRIPERVVRHSLAARLFHWVMAAAVLTLLFTGFLPVLGVRFDWVTIHWMAGLVFIASILYHGIHASFWMNLRDIWVSGSDWREWWQEVQHSLGGSTAPPPKPGKYPVDQKLFHHLVAIAGFGVIVTGVLMMFRVPTPFWARNPYLLSDSTWGLVYVVHGLSAVGLVGMTMAHVYFAVLPEKRWLTVSMIAGWITRKDFLRNHDPERWVVTPESGASEGTMSVSSAASGE